MTATQTLRKARKTQWEALSRSAIQDAVVRLIGRGAGEVTMAKVAAEAGLAKGTLYLYFRDKQQLLACVRERSLDALGTELHLVLASEGTARERLERLVRRHIGYCEENRELLRVLLWDRQFAARQTRHRRSDRFRELVVSVADLLADGVREGQLRAMDSGKVAAMLLEAIIASISLRLEQEAPGPAEEDARMILDVFLDGLSVRPEATT
jgi:AcrR family transcriptional regulator